MDYNELMEMAKKASENSYSPYSKFPVGACALFESGKTYIGTNVENASYGATICAERSAILNAIVNGERKLTAIAIYGPKMKRCAPCGPCRQVINEFRSENGSCRGQNQSRRRLQFCFGCESQFSELQ